MKTKIIIIVVILFTAIIAGVIYYVKNIMTVYDKDGMIYNTEDYTQLNDSDNLNEGDV